ncbi:MAG: hypothetical protein DLM69_07515 [Candidatus Chloroheliales bacterium]|nr:MAG: hypothetical protein DLM69_07515 [Chloroflexota bacterium]
MFEQLAWTILLITAIVVLLLWYFFSRPQLWQKLDRVFRGFLLVIAAIAALVVLFVGGYLGAVLGGLPGFILGGLLGLGIATLIVMHFFAHANLL